MMGAEMPETCWAVHTNKRQVINLRHCCIWLVDLFEKLTVLQPIKKFPLLYGNQRFITLFTRVLICSCPEPV
jgi:hypothetical protein